MVTLVLAVACATTVTEDELNSICAQGQCAKVDPPPPDPDGGVQAGNTNGGGGSTAVAGSANAGSPNTGGMQGGGGSTGGGGSGGGGAGNGGGGAGNGGAGAAGTAGMAGGGAAGSGGGGAAGAAGAGAGAGGAAGTAGAAGSAGAGGAAACPAKTTWTATASSYCGQVAACADPNGPFPPSMAIDASGTTRFSSGQGMAGNEWLEIDLKVTASLDGITITTAASNADDYGRQYAVRLSGTSNNMGAPIVVQGAGMTGTTTLNFPDTTTGRYLLITQTMPYAASWWSVHDITIDCSN